MALATSVLNRMNILPEAYLQERKGWCRHDCLYNKWEFFFFQICIQKVSFKRCWLLNQLMYIHNCDNDGLFSPSVFLCFFFSSSDSSFRYNSGHIFPPCNASGLFVTHRSPSSFHNLPYRVVVCLEVFAWHLSVVKKFWWPNVWFCFFPTSFHAKLFW